MSPDLEASFGDRLRRLREAAGLTQEELAGRAGLSLNAVSDLERGRRRHPYPHTVRALAEALELPEKERAALAASVPRRGGAARAARAAPAAGLPEPPSPLIGRGRDVEQLGAVLRRGAGRLLTLTGPGGVGKTRLALEVARNVAGEYPDGAFFVGLAPLGDPDLVVPTVARALGLREPGEEASRDTLRAYLQRRKLLLVLDNFEHLLGAAPEVASLLGAAPGLVALATSRAPLRVRGEVEYPVGPLAVPDPSRAPDVERVAGSPAAELFARRAHATNPAFVLTRKNAAAVAAICWRLDGLPLALELAAARARFLGPTELLARLDGALEAGGARDLPERQRTMRAALDWSFGLLAGDERVLFRTLSVFAGGFTLEAAESVAEDLGAARVADLLGALVEQSLVAADTDAGGGGARYRLLEPVRQYAVRRLEESGGGERTRGRHAGYYRHLAERARGELQGPRQADWLDRLAREHDNVRAAMAWLLEGSGPEEAARIGWGLYDFWFRRGYTAEGLRWMERVLASGGALPVLARARAQWVISALSFVRGDLDRAVAVAAESAAAARAAGDPEALAYALEMQGVAAVSRGDPDTAEAALPEAEALFRGRGDAHGVASGLYGLANLALARGDGDEAMRLIAEGEVIAREAGNWNMLATCLDMQALSTRLADDDARTAGLLRESVGLAGMLRDEYNLVYCATGLAGVAARQGRAERAARLFGAAEALSERTGARVSWSAWRSLNERDLAATRAMLGPEAFEAAWAQGRAMTLDEVVAEALAEDA